MTEGTEDASAGPPPTPAPASPAGTGDPGLVPKEKPQEVEPVAEAREEESAAAAQGAPGGAPEGGASPAGERPPGVVALPAPCCVCVDVEQVEGCLQSEKICILPILACLLSLALCTAGLKWVFVDKIFQHQPPTHPKPRMAAEPTLGLTTPPPYSSPSSGTTSAVLVEQPSTGRPPVLPTGRAAPPDPAVPAYSSAAPSVSKQAPPLTTAAWELVATLSTTTAKTSSHVTPCSDSQRNYCVNGGECFTLEIMPGSTKFLCRCPNEFTGDRCQNYVMASFYKAEELYQKRVLTIAGICIALLVVGVVCVVAYCRTKTQRRKLHQHLRQSLRNQRKAAGALATKPQGGGAARGHAPTLPLRDLQRMNRGSGTPEHADEKEAETSFSTAKYAFSGPEATTATRLSSQRSTWPPASASPRLERTSQTMSATSITFSLSAEDDCLLLPSTPPQPWSPAERRRRGAHGQRSALADEGPAGPGLPPEKVEQRVSSPASSAASETSLSSGGGSSQASPEAEVDADRLEEPRAETRPFFSAAGASRLLPGPWYGSSSTAAPPSSQRQRPCRPVAPEHHLLAV